MRRHQGRPNTLRAGISVTHLLTGSLTSLLTFLLCSSIGESCPGCKEALFDPAGLPQRLSTARGYALSIGLLLTIPAGLVGTLTALIVRAHRRTLRDKRSVSDA